MTDIRTRLADALRDQFPDSTPLQRDYAAGVLLSLPGIAIMDFTHPDYEIAYGRGYQDGVRQERANAAGLLAADAAEENK